MYIPMNVSTVTVDPVSNSPIVILKEIDGDKILPIWIGIMEATAIASELEKIKFSRPMTHDLIKNIMDTLDVKITRVEVCDLRDNTYYALIHLLTSDGKEYAIDARPSDALALSLRTNAPIFVKEEVILKSVRLTEDDSDESEKGKRWKKILESLKPEDFGKYKM